MLKVEVFLGQCKQVRSLPLGQPEKQPTVEMNIPNLISLPIESTQAALFSLENSHVDRTPYQSSLLFALWMIKLVDELGKSSPWAK